MTYRAGIGDGMQRFGLLPGPPHIRCDAPGCDETLEARSPRIGCAPAWLLNGTAPRGWKMLRVGDGLRRDFCPAHHAEWKAERKAAAP